MKLNGWQRLWVLVGLLYGLVVIGVTIAQFSNRDHIDYLCASRVITTIEESIFSELMIPVVNVRQHADFRGKSDLEIAENFSKGAHKLTKDGSATPHQINAGQLVKEHNEKRAHDLEALPME